MTRPADFALERYFARWEFVCRHNLCASGIEGWSLRDLLALADDDTRRRWEDLTLGYTESAGLPALREEIAKRYAGLSAEHVHCFAGAEEAIFMLMSSLIEPGDHVVVVRPAYQSLFEIARARGAELGEIWLRHEDRFALDVDALERAITPRTRLIVVNFPHNPTGTTIDAATQARLVALADRHGCFLLSDEVYRGLERTGVVQLPAAAMLHPRVLSLGAMAKAHGLAGLRVGWLVIRDAALRTRVASLKDYGSMCNAAPSEVLALLALRHEQAVLSRSHAIVDANLPVMTRFFAEHADRLSCVPSRAGVTVFPRFVDGTDVDRFCDDLVQKTGVLLLPGSTYGTAEPAFRMGFGRRDFALGIEKLGAFLRA